MFDSDGRILHDSIPACFHLLLAQLLDAVSIEALVAYRKGILELNKGQVNKLAEIAETTAAGARRTRFNGESFAGTSPSC